MAPCKFFLQGWCANGETCRFEHQRTPTATTGRKLQGARDAQPPPLATPLTFQHGRTLPIRGTGATPCRFFRAGTCAKGATCPFSHALLVSLAPDEQDAASASGSAVTDTRSAVPCQFFIRGGCKNGDRCPYLHERAERTGGQISDEDGVKVSQLNTSLGGRESMLIHWQDKPDQDDFVRLQSGVIACFTEGAVVANIQLPWEHSGIRIQGLPGDSTPQSVLALVRGAGYLPTSTSVKLWKPATEVHTNALVNLKDESSAKQLSQTLSGIGYPNLHASPAEPSLPLAMGSRRLSSRKIAMSWHKPTRLVWLNFGDEFHARNAANGFNTGEFRVFDQTVDASEPKRSARIAGRGRGMMLDRNNQVPWTVVLKNVPAAVSKEDVTKALPPMKGPRHVELSPVKATANEDMIEAVVRSVLTSIGPVDFELVPGLSTKRTKSRALFDTDEHAREAAKVLKENLPAPLKDASFVAQLVTSARFKIARSVHDKVEPELQQSYTNDAAKAVRIKEFVDPVAERFVTIKIESEDLPAVKKCVDSVEGIIRGTVILDDNTAPFWSPALAAHTSQHRLRRIEREFYVCLLRDLRERQLRMVGSPKKHEQVRAAVIAQFSRAVVKCSTIILTNEQFLWACRGGFNQIVTTLGRDVASFDIASSPKKIIVTGSEVECQRAVNMIQGKCLPSGVETDAADKDCAICYNEAEDPVATACSHRYCFDCFENMCRSAASAANEGGIRCQGEMGACPQSLSLQMLQDSLSSAAFEDVLESAFNAHIQHRPAQYRYCPTPDCGNIYRVSEASKNHTCTGCLTMVCTRCHGQHATMTCADYKDLKSGGYAAFERLKKELKIKDCPKCSTPIEKTDGCNHMECGGCGTHICWVCMKIFDEPGGGTIYQHMNSAHGSIGIEFAGF